MEIVLEMAKVPMVDHETEMNPLHYHIQPVMKPATHTFELA